MDYFFENNKNVANAYLFTHLLIAYDTGAIYNANHTNHKGSDSF